MLRLLLIFLLALAPLAPAAAGTSLFTDTPKSGFLDPDEAFQLELSARDSNTLAARFTIAPGYYLYRDRITLTLAPGSASTVAGLELPPGETKRDPNFGDTQVYYRNAEALVRLAHAGVPPAAVSVEASYQGCSEEGLCYAPIKQTLTVSLAGGAAAAPGPSGAPLSESGVVRQLLADGKLWLVVAGFFGFGLLLSLTPCVFPMIPILSSIIVGQGQHPTRLHAFNLSLAYTLGMAITYTLAGIAAAYSGQLISAALQTPWALGFGALMFVVLALSMFGFYELRLPSGLESRMAGFSNRLKGGRLVGVFAMGALSALIIGPCVAAPLAGALLYIGQTHDVLLGGAALFSLSLGMGVPLLLVGASAGALLPRSGPWMNAVKNFFGVVLLAMAVWLLGPAIPAALQMGLWATILIVSAIYLRALDALPARSSRWPKLWKGVGVIALVAGIALLLGALAGNRNPLQPLAGLGLSARADAAAEALPFAPVRSIGELDAALLRARGKPVMLDYYADWCVACKEYEQFTFRDPRVAQLLGQMTLLKADVTHNSAADTELLARYELFGPPALVFFDAAGNELRALRTVGYQDADRFLVTLNSVFASKGGACPTALEC